MTALLSGKFTKHCILAVVLSIGLAACNTASDRPNPVAGGGGLAGNWSSLDNVYTASFENGTFVSTANDNGAELARGNYIVLSRSEIKLDFVRARDGQSASAVCQRPDPVTLSCVDGENRPFSLRKV